MMKKRLLISVIVVLAVAMAGCVGPVAEEENGDTKNAEPSEEFKTFTKPAAGTDAYWSCISWQDYNGHKMECELVDEKS